MNMYTVRYGQSYHLKDKEILSVISESGYQSVKDIREKLDMKPELFSVYRDRLKRKVL